MKPSTGRIIHYRLPDGDGEERWRPAVVITVVEEELEMLPPITRYRVNVVVMLDERADADIPTREGCAHTVWRGDALEGSNVGHWRWPPRD